MGELLDRINEVNYWIAKGLHPYVGGDFNNRIGNMNSISDKSLKWRCSENVDKDSNSNKCHFTSMCEMLKVLPLNHCKFYNRQFDGGFTYFKADRKSQIDFVVTDNVGRRDVVDFKLVTQGWHFSDHLPMDLKIRSKYVIDPLSIYIRSKALVEPTHPTKSVLRINRKNFDSDLAKVFITNHSQELSIKCHSLLNTESIVENVYDLLDAAINHSVYSLKRNPILLRTISIWMNVIDTFNST